ncbi:hypothetical protein ACH42_00760 [Endozoicomonas sp. (ex Bugula neritina AB1)]|nr:hypothetical protein ACH42_00760 [Endozoicomonas sp. (ex Bugula neritina AB1)]
MKATSTGIVQFKPNYLHFLVILTVSLSVIFIGNTYAIGGESVVLDLTSEALKQKGHGVRVKVSGTIKSVRETDVIESKDYWAGGAIHTYYSYRFITSVLTDNLILYVKEQVGEEVVLTVTGELEMSNPKIGTKGSGRLYFIGSEVAEYHDEL